MAGAVKHMERSRRSHRKPYGTFNQFHQHAYKVAMYKEQKKTIGQRFSEVFKKLLPNTSSK